MILRRKGVALVRCDFVATVDTAVNSGVGRRFARAPFPVKSSVVCLLENSSILVHGHENKSSAQGSGLTRGAFGSVLPFGLHATSAARLVGCGSY